MKGQFDASRVQTLSGGINQSGVRDYNERLLMSMIQRSGGMPGSELARLSSLSPQTVSVITRRLENEGFLQRGDPVRGKVGKPSTPMELVPDGVFSFGLKIGRRSAALLLLDFTGRIRRQNMITFSYPMPETIFDFLKVNMAAFQEDLAPEQVARIAGLGVAMPSELWNWHELLGAPREEFMQWKFIDFQSEVAKFTDLPVFMLNDATAACRAEHSYGRGREHRDYAYFYVGTFIGGGVVMNNAVHVGNQENAGAFGALRTAGHANSDLPLIDVASIFVLENMLIKDDVDPSVLWRKPLDWSGIDQQLIPWMDQVGKELARAALVTCAVIDFEAVLIDGAFPEQVRSAIVKRAKAALEELDTRGIILPRIEEGTIGQTARELGAASGPIFEGYFLTAASTARAV